MKQVRFIRISFFLCALFALVAFWAGFYYGNTQLLSNHKATGNNSENVTNVTGTTYTQAGIVSSDDTVESMQTLIPESYTLKCNADDLVVYKGTTEEIYFETGLKITDLPETLQRQVRGGIIFETLPDLYSFLENYSS